MGYTLIATKAAITNPRWIFIYVISGLIGSLIIDWIVKKVKAYVLTIGGNQLHGGIE